LCLQGFQRAIDRNDRDEKPSGVLHCDRDQQRASPVEKGGKNQSSSTSCARWMITTASKRENSSQARGKAVRISVNMYIYDASKRRDSFFSGRRCVLASIGEKYIEEMRRKWHRSKKFPANKGLVEIIVISA
jgi:hypothetical protein